MKANGMAISVMDEVLNYSLTVTHIKVNMSMDGLTVKEFIHGRVQKYMMVSGKAEPSQDTAFGRESTVKAISDSGLTAKLKATVSTYGATATNTKASGTAAFATATALISSKTVTST